jgi:integrating conjugative element membrane protein (TIGR03747 family)
MSQQATRPQPPLRPSAMALLVQFIFAFVMSFILSVIIGCLIEWAGMHWWWKDAGVAHSRDMVAEDLGYLHEYPRSLLTDDTVAFAQRWSDGITRAAAFVGLLRFIDGAHLAQPRNQLEVTLARVRAVTLPYLISGVYVAQDAAIRLAIVFLALPAFFLAVAVGLIDGLGRRDVRRWSGGRESAFLYHGAKRLIKPAFTGGFTLYLTWPTGGFNPAWMVLPFCVAVGATFSLVASSFKKYL